MKIKSYILLFLFVANFFVPSNLFSQEARSCCKIGNGIEKSCCSKHQKQEKKETTNRGCKCIQASVGQSFFQINHFFDLSLTSFNSNEVLGFNFISSNLHSGYLSLFTLPKIA